MLIQKVAVKAVLTDACQSGRHMGVDVREFFLFWIFQLLFRVFLFLSSFFFWCRHNLTS